MRVLSLFSGVGGFDLGFERAGMEIVACVEKDPEARKVLGRHFPHAAICDDVTTFNYSPEEHGSIDVVCGGFPCQDLSVAGRRAGLAGGRSGLFYEACRIIGQARPRWVVVENVPGLLSSNRGRDMLAVLRSLAELGYVGCYRVLDSQYFGVAQRRRRVFIVGHLAGPDAERAGRVLFEPESLRGDSPPSREAGEGVAGTLEARAGAGGFPRSDGAMSGHVVAGTLSANCGGLNRPAGNANELDFCIPVLEVSARVGHSAEGSAGIGNNGDPMFTLQAGKQHGVGTWAVPAAMRGRGDAYDLECAEGPAHGLRAGKAGMVATRYVVRRLTPTECERLQGFPDGWTEGHSKTARYRFMGNAVTVNVAEWIGRRMMQATPAR